MKKTILFTALILFFFFPSPAQNLWVCSSNGSVEVYSKGTWGDVVPYQKIALTDSICFGTGSSITILDRQSEKLLSIQKVGTHCVKSLVSESKLRSRKLSMDVFSYIWSSLRGKNNIEKYQKAAGVVYRDDDINASIAGAVVLGTANLPVELALFDGETGQTVEDSVSVGSFALAKIMNHSDSDLFVNMIDVDTNGTMSVCFPVTSVQQITKLLIPAGSEVILDSFPIVFTEPRGVDQMVLVASPEWFDIDSVVQCLKTGKTTHKKLDVGVFKQRLIVR